MAEIEITRQIQVLHALSQGWDEPKIAKHLKVAISTVKRDTAVLRRQYGCKTRVELVLMAFKSGQKVLGER